MRKITVLIDKSGKTIDLQESILALNLDPYLLVKKATIFWDYVNVTSANDKISYNSNNHVLAMGITPLK